MSKTVDEKVVEMKFDNSHFERNVQGTLSTLDKLKAKLNFGGAAKSFEQIEDASKKVSFDGLTNGLQTVQMKFSAMEVVGVTALANITNAAVDAAKNITMSLLGIPAMKAGFEEYSMTMNTVQTLVNSTGKSIDEVNKSLKELDEYADKTVYSTADMFNNIYKFTNAGISLEDAKTAMIGIANATAHAGQGARQASIAYYNLAQSMSMGYLTRIDYKSIALANINTDAWKNKMVEAAIAAGTLQKVEDNLYKAGQKQYTLQALFTEGLQEQWATTDVMMDVFKQYGDQETEIGKKAWAAAQEVKTFSMMLETLRAQAGTGWKDTWAILFGDLEQSKRVWTGLTNFIGYFVNAIDNWRNRILDIAMNNPLKAIYDKINNSEALKAFQEVTDKVKQTSKTLEEYQNMVWRIWRGDFNNQPYREALVEAEGYSYGVTQSLVNLSARLDENGRGWRAISQITEDDVISAEKEFGIEAEEITETLTEQTEAIKELTDEKLKEIGLTDEEIKMYRQLEKGAKRYGLSIEEIIKKMDEATGRDLLYGSEDGKVIGAFQHIGNVITSIIQSIKTAWTDVFDGITGVDLYMIIDRFQKFTEKIENFLKDNDRLRKISETFRGLFSAIHIVAQVISGPFKIAFQILKGILSAFHINILDFTSMIGNMLYNLDRWITENNIIVNAVKTLTEWIIKTVNATIEWVKSNEKIMEVVNKIKEAFHSVKESVTSWIEGLKNAENIPEYIFGGLLNGIKDNGPKVWEAIKDVAQGMIDAICKVLKIASPSKVMFAIGGFIIAGLIAGMQQQEISLWDFIGDLGSKLIDFFKGIKISDIIAAGVTAGIIVTANKALDLLDRLSAPFQGLANALTGLSNLFTDTGVAVKRWGRAMQMQGIAAMLKSFAIAIGVLVAAVVILGKLPSDELHTGGAALAQIILVLTGAIAALAFLSKQLTNINALDMGKMFGLISSIVFGIMMIAIALKVISSIDPDRMGPSIVGLISCVAMLGGLVVGMAFLQKKLELSANFGSLGNMMLKVATSILLVAVALKMLNNVEWESIGKMATIFVAVGALLAYIITINNVTASGMQKASDTILAAAGALILLVIAMKLSGSLRSKDFANGVVVMGIFIGFLTALMAISRLFRNTEMMKVGGSLLLIIVALGMMALVMKLLSNMEPEAIKKGLKCISLMSGLVVALIAVSRNSRSFHGSTLIGVGVAIAAMSAAVWFLGMLDPERARKGLVCVSILTALVDSLILVAHGLQADKSVVKMLVTITVMIAILAAAMIGLSFIDSERLMSSAGALTMIISALSGVILAASNMKAFDWKKFLSLAAIVGVIAILAQIVSILSEIPNSDGAIKNAAALTILAVAAAVLAFALSKMNMDPKNWKEIATGIGALTAMVIPFYAFGQALKSMDGVNVNAESIGVLAAILTAMVPLLAAVSGLAFALDKFGKDKWTALKSMGIGIGSLTGMVLPLLGLVQVLRNLQDVKVDQESVNNLILLTSVITAISAVMLAMGLIIELSGGTAWVAMAVAIGTLTLMIVPLFAFLGVLGAMKDIPDAAKNAEALADFAERITGMLVQLSLLSPLLAATVASITGLVVLIGIVGTLAVAVGELMEYVPNLKYFLDKGLDIFEGIAESLGRILGKFIDSFATTATANLGLIGTRLSEFAVNSMPFIILMNSLDDKVIKGAGYMAGAVMALSAANFVEAITKFLSGGVSFARLGSELSSFAINSSEFIKAMGEMDPKVADAAKSMSDAILALTASNALDSLTAWLTGGKDLASFSDNLGNLGKGLRAFVNGLIGDEGTFGEDEIETVNCGANALSSITNVVGQIQATGGLLQGLTGTVDIAGFSSTLEGLGSGIRSFAMALIGDGSFGSDEIDTINCGAEALGKIAEAASKISSTGGVNEYFNGVKDLAGFASKLGDVGKSIRGFVWEILQDNVITTDSKDAIDIVLNIITSMASLGDIDINKAADGLEKLGKKLGEVGKNVSEFVKTFSSLDNDNLKNAKEKFDTIIELAKKMIDINYESLNKVGDALKKIGNDSIKDFIKGLNYEGKPKSDAEEVVKEIINAMISKAENKRGDIEKSAKTVATYATEALYCNEIQEKVSTAGTNFIQGFANALKDPDNKVYNAAYRIGEKAVTAINTATDVHSPSRETYKTGKFFDLGFINGIKEYANRVYSESYSVGDEAKNGLTNAISRIANIMDSEMDTSPTIRPVLDLSDIQNGVGTLDSMFGSPSIGVMSNLNAISSGMVSNGQNSGEIVNAINKLRKDLGSVTSNTYNINGVTYDDGSEIQEAVGTLVRAARIERRM